jgi:hypothetical protein
MASVGVTRKLFIDSRYKVSGTDADFLCELPVDVDCTRTSSFFVASCSFANTYQTVTQFNCYLYYFLIDNSGVAQNPYNLYVSQIAVGSYTSDTIAPVLKTALGAGCASVTWNPNSGTFDIEFIHPAGTPPQYIIPAYNDIDTIVQKMQGHLSIFGSYAPGSKFQSINALLNMPSVLPFPNDVIAGAFSFTTGVVDLAPLREVYLHCSVANNRTLHVNGARDCIARIPIDVPYGDVVTYRHLGPTDALSCSDFHFRTIRFQLRDWAGNLAPTGSFVVVELCFLDTDPYAM